MVILNFTLTPEAGDFPTFRDTGSFSRVDNGTTGNEEKMEGIAASQTLSQVQGLW
jgi:cell cycle checkpoint control protein RAD9A